MGRADDVVDRLRAVYNAKSDSELARIIGVGTSTVANWRTRDSVPYPQCVTVAKDKGLSLDWLVLGEGEMRRTITGDGTGTLPENCDASVGATAIRATEQRVAEHAASYGALSPQEEAVLSLFRALDDDAQRELKNVAEEKKRLREVEQRLRDVETELAARKRA